jgi:aspartate kinase
MSGETNRLVALGRSVSPRPAAREMDVLQAAGEQVTIALLAMALTDRGRPGKSYLADQVAIRTDSSFGKARISAIDTDKLLADIAQGIVPVIAGFQGVDGNGNLTTLGRGGSDTTAVAIAAALRADECEICTDVDGVYTADPRTGDLRGDAGAGQPRLEGTAPALGGVCRQVSGSPARAVVVRGRPRHADHHGEQ